MTIRTGSLRALVTALLLLLTSGLALGQDGRAVVFEGARLIKGDGAAPLEDAVFVVEDGRFVAVGGAGAVAAPGDAARVDLGGMTVMPAIVDAHVHLSTTPEALVEDLERRAFYGIGAAVSLGADGEDAPLELREAPIPNAALYLSAGLGITAPEPGRRRVHWVTSETQAREAVRDEAARDVDVVKIWVDDRGGRYEKLAPALYRAIIDEAHEHDLRVTAHIFALEDAKDLLRAGVDMFAHGVRDRDVDDEFVELVAQRPEVILVANLPSRGVPAELGWLEESIRASELAALESEAAASPEVVEAFAIQARNLERLSEAGMKIALGTDGNTPWAPHVEMRDMVAAGMSPAEVIVAATRNAAEAAGLADRGTIAAGMSADFIVLEADPLVDITNTRRIDAVYLRGRRVDRETLAAGWTGSD